MKVLWLPVCIPMVDASFKNLVLASYSNKSPDHSSNKVNCMQKIRKENLMVLKLFHRWGV